MSRKRLKNRTQKKKRGPRANNSLLEPVKMSNNPMLSNNLKAAEAKRLVSINETNRGESRTLALGSGGLDDTTDEDDDF